MNLSPETLRKRFHELTARAEKIRAKADPLRGKRDALLGKHGAEIDPLNAKIRKAEDGLFEIEQERAMIARALAGKVGAPDRAK